VSRTRRWQLAVIVLAVVFAVVPIPRAWIEVAFSTRFYPIVQHILTPATNLIPVALLDLLIVAAVVSIVGVAVRAVRAARQARRLAVVVDAVAALAAGAALVYLTFLALWGLNYRRVRMSERLEVQRGAPSPAAVLSLGLDSVRHMNELYAAAHASGFHPAEWRDAQLRVAFAATQRLLSDAWPAEPGRLKWTMLGPYFRWTSVDGMVDPFALEVLANPDLLPWERPFVAAHEWSHLAGYADESEANFVGWLTCLRADTASQYSGWLYLYWQISGEVGAAERARMAGMLAAGPRRDLDAIVQRLRRGQLPLLRNASWRVYDQYLRANRVEEGIRSYGEVVTLILRARFENGWTPVRRSVRASSP
jgi:hypothetical protein